MILHMCVKIYISLIQPICDKTYQSVYTMAANGCYQFMEGKDFYHQCSDSSFSHSWTGSEARVSWNQVAPKLNQINELGFLRRQTQPFYIKYTLHIRFITM